MTPSPPTTAPVPVAIAPTHVELLRASLFAERVFDTSNGAESGQGFAAPYTHIHPVPGITPVYTPPLLPLLIVIIPVISLIIRNRIYSSPNLLFTLIPGRPHGGVRAYTPAPASYPSTISVLSSDLAAPFAKYNQLRITAESSGSTLKSSSQTNELQLLCDFSTKLTFLSVHGQPRYILWPTMVKPMYIHHGTTHGMVYGGTMASTMVESTDTRHGTTNDTVHG